MNGSGIEGPVAWAALFGVGAVSGVINVLAGGGSMLTLPVMIFLGLPPTVANGTNRVGILIQNLGAVESFRRHRLMRPDWLKLAIPPSLVGAVIGTWLAVRVGDLAFQRILAVMMVAIALWMIWNPLRPEVEPDPERAVPAPEGAGRRAAFGFAFFLCGIYGGFIQAGLGFLVLAVCALAAMDLLRANALKMAVNLAFTPLAIGIFWWAGMIDWGWGIALGAGNLVGALVGVRLAIFKGEAWVRRFVTAAIVVFAVRLLFFG